MLLLFQLMWLHGAYFQGQFVFNQITTNYVTLSGVGIFLFSQLGPQPIFALGPVSVNTALKVLVKSHTW